MDRASAPAEGSRTLAAGRAFLAALASDLALLGRHVARWFRALTKRASRSLREQRAGALQRVLVRFAGGTAVLAVLGVLVFAGAMVWALHDLPPEKPVAEGNTPALILEASNGASLGRVGPLRMPDAGVQHTLPATARAWFGSWQEVPLLASSSLVGETAGPALIVEPHSTVVLEPGWRARRLAGGELMLEAQPAAGPSQTAAATPRALAPGPRTGADPARIEIFNNLFMHIAEQMGEVLKATAQSVNIKERLDYSCALFDAAEGWSPTHRTCPFIWAPWAQVCARSSMRSARACEPATPGC